MASLADTLMGVPLKLSTSVAKIPPRRKHTIHKDKPARELSIEQRTELILQRIKAAPTASVVSKRLLYLEYRFTLGFDTGFVLAEQQGYLLKVPIGGKVFIYVRTDKQDEGKQK
jgi:hypothetical protein